MFSRFASTLKSIKPSHRLAIMATPIVIVSQTSTDTTSTNDKSHHKKGGGFVNPWESFTQHGMNPATMYQMFKDWESNPVPPPENLPLLTTPEFTPSPSIASSPSELTSWNADIKATFLGHACFLVEFPRVQGQSRGMRVLFDPVWSNRCSPSQLVGPARVAKPPIKLEEIPQVDAVVISHNHYDHLDITTLKHLYKSQPRGSIHFFAPLGNAQWFVSNIGCNKNEVSEMDWQESRNLTLRSSSPSPSMVKGEEEGKIEGELRITAEKCQHFTGRGIFDRNDTLWASWVVENVTENGGGGKVWFAGDTGYRSIPRGVPIEEEDKYRHCPAFEEIGKREGPFDFSMIPIGAYDPRWFMSSIHCSPEDSVELHRETKSRRSLGMHHSCWMLTCEPMDEPPKRLRAACEKYGISEEEFGISGLGETKRFKVEKRE